MIICKWLPGEQGTTRKVSTTQDTLCRDYSTRYPPIIPNSRQSIVLDHPLAYLCVMTVDLQSDCATGDVGSFSACIDRIRNGVDIARASLSDMPSALLWGGGLSLGVAAAFTTNHIFSSARISNPGARPAGPTDDTLSGWKSEVSGITYPSHILSATLPPPVSDDTELHAMDPSLRLWEEWERKRDFILDYEAYRLDPLRDVVTDAIDGVQKLDEFRAGGFRRPIEKLVRGKKLDKRETLLFIGHSRCAPKEWLMSCLPPRKYTDDTGITRDDRQPYLDAWEKCTREGYGKEFSEWFDSVRDHCDTQTGTREDAEASR